MESLILLFFIPAILISSIIPLTYRYKENRGIETESSTIVENYIYAFTMISFWIGILFSQNKLYIYIFISFWPYSIFCLQNLHRRYYEK